VARGRTLGVPLVHTGVVTVAEGTLPWVWPWVRPWVSLGLGVWAWEVRKLGAERVAPRLMGTPREDRDPAPSPLPHWGVEGSDRLELSFSEFPQFLPTKSPEFMGVAPRLEREKASGVEGSEAGRVPQVYPRSGQTPRVPPPSEGVEGNPVGLLAERAPGLAHGVPGSEGIVGKGRGNLSWGEGGGAGGGGLRGSRGMLRRLRLRAPFLKLGIAPEIGPKLNELKFGFTFWFESGPGSGPE